MVRPVKPAWRLTKIAGIEVRVHWTFLLLLGFYAWTYYTEPGLAEGARVGSAVQGVVFTLLIFGCVVLHEFGHAFAARAFGIRTPDITLYPIGGVARLERMPRSPVQELVIAVAGPAVNVAIAVGILLVLGGLSATDWTPLDRAGGGLATGLLQVNILLVVFNMLPAFPMDGGRVLRALLAMIMDHTKATRIAARIGQGVAVLLALASVVWGFGGPMMLFIAAFVFMAAQQELACASFRGAVDRLRVGDLMQDKFVAIPVEATSAEAVSIALGSDDPAYVFTDADMRLRGMMTRGELAEAVRSTPPHQPVASRAAQVAALRPADGALATIERMQTELRPALPVVNGSGQVVGIVTAAVLARALSRSG